MTIFTGVLNDLRRVGGGDVMSLLSFHIVYKFSSKNFLRVIAILYKCTYLNKLG